MTSSRSAITQQLLNKSFSAFAQQLLSIGSGVTQHLSGVIQQLLMNYLAIADLPEVGQQLLINSFSVVA